MADTDTPTPRRSSAVLTTYSARRPLIVAEDAEIVGTLVHLAADVEAWQAEVRQRVEALQGKVWTMTPRAIVDALDVLKEIL